MTLIVARKFENIILVLSDSFSENTTTKEKFNWYSNPIRKIFELSDRFLISFSGNSHNFLKLMGEQRNSSSLTIFEIASSASNFDDIELLVVDMIEMRLYTIKNGECRETDVGYAGSPSGFEIFQRNRHSEKGLPDTYTHMHRVPDGLSNEARALFESYNRAFAATLLDTDLSFGGVPICWYCTENIREFNSCLTNTRGSVDPEELKENTWVKLQPQDKFGGAFTTSVWGSERGVAIYYPEISFGLIHDGTFDEGVEYHRIPKVDGYEFTMIAKERQCGAGISSWDSFENRARKINQTLLEGRFNFASDLIRDARSEILSDLHRENKDMIDSLPEPESFVEIGGRVSIQTIYNISQYLHLKCRYQSEIGDSAESLKTRRLLDILLEAIKELKFEFSWKQGPRK